MYTLRFVVDHSVFVSSPKSPCYKHFLHPLRKAMDWTPFETKKGNSDHSPFFVKHKYHSDL